MVAVLVAVVSAVVASVVAALAVVDWAVVDMEEMAVTVDKVDTEDKEDMAAA